MNGSDDWAYNFASGTRLDCLLYANGTQFGANASCSEVANGYGVDQADLVAWNPSLNTTCTLNGDLTYCVRFVGHNATNFTQYCVLDDAPGFNTTCAEFLAVWGVGLDDFAQWNPGVGSNCENWDNGTFDLQFTFDAFADKNPPGKEPIIVSWLSISANLATSRPATSSPWPMIRTVSCHDAPFLHEKVQR